MATLRPWSPSDALAAGLVDLIRRAERETLAVAAPVLRQDRGQLRGRADDGGAQLAVDDDVGVRSRGLARAPGVAGSVPVPRVVDDHGASLPRYDALADLRAAWPRVAATLRSWLSSPRITETLRRTGDQARQAADRQWSRELGRAVGIDIPVDSSASRELVEAWIAENTARIQGLRDEALRRMRDDLETAVLSGARPEELAAKWEREGLPTKNGRLRGRATVIARHQLGLLATQIAEHHAQALGLDSYTWDSRDGDTRQQRPVHRGRDGASYRWASPPPGGHPGTEVGCRCGVVVEVDRAELRRRFTIAA
jgi:SPP1 gp7 family putative phage head morphogenesis protein